MVSECQPANNMNTSIINSMYLTFEVYLILKRILVFTEVPYLYYVNRIDNHYKCGSYQGRF